MFPKMASFFLGIAAGAAVVLFLIFAAGDKATMREGLIFLPITALVLSFACIASDD